jgi:methanogenic corrinoid protein MtbC1
LVRPELLGLPDLDAVVADVPRPNLMGGRLRDHLVEGNDAAARGLLISMYLGGMTIADIADGPISAAMTSIGELWQHQREGIFLEHRATDICVQGVIQLRMLLEQPATDAPHAVGGALSGDPYMLASLLAACVLAENGFLATNLGADTPPGSLLHAVADQQAILCWVSLNSVTNTQESSAMLHDLVKGLDPMGTTLIVGGRACTSVEMPHGKIHVAQSMNSLANLAGLVKTSHAVRPSRAGAAYKSPD